MAIQEYIVPIVAAYGAILSTAIFIQKWYETKPKIKIDVYIGEDFDEGKGVGLIVRNFGMSSITLSHAFIEEVPSSSMIENFLNKIHKTTNELEKSLLNDRDEGTEITRGKNCIIFFSFSEYIHEKWLENHITCRGIVVDQLGHKYRTKPIKIELPY
jgi:hypothetical protein